MATFQDIQSRTLDVVRALLPTRNFKLTVLASAGTGQILAGALAHLAPSRVFLACPGMFGSGGASEADVISEELDCLTTWARESAFMTEVEAFVPGEHADGYGWLAESIRGSDLVVSLAPASGDGDNFMEQICMEEQKPLVRVTVPPEGFGAAGDSDPFDWATCVRVECILWF